MSDAQRQFADALSLLTGRLPKFVRLVVEEGKSHKDAYILAGYNGKEPSQGLCRIRKNIHVRACFAAANKMAGEKFDVSKDYAASYLGRAGYHLRVSDYYNADGSYKTLDKIPEDAQDFIRHPRFQSGRQVGWELVDEDKCRDQYSRLMDWDGADKKGTEDRGYLASLAELGRHKIIITPCENPEDSAVRHLLPHLPQPANGRG